MKKLFILAAALVLLASCKKETVIDNRPIDQPSFTYLKVGNKWVYDFLYNGSPVDSLIYEIKGEVNGVYETSMKDKTMTLKEWMFVEGDKLKSFGVGKEKSEANTVAIKSPKVGDTWYKYFDGDSSKVEIIETVKAVETPAGTFSCNVLRESSSNGQIVTTYANPFIGLVKIEMNNQSGNFVWLLRKKNF